jgi:hypothetical protein
MKTTSWWRISAIITKTPISAIDGLLVTNQFKKFQRSIILLLLLTRVRALRTTISLIKRTSTPHRSCMLAKTTICWTNELNLCKQARLVDSHNLILTLACLTRNTSDTALKFSEYPDKPWNGSVKHRTSELSNPPYKQHNCFSWQN